MNPICSVSCNGRLTISCFISQSFAFESLQSYFGSLSVIDAELGAGVHAEVEFREIPIQVLFVHVLVDAHQTALEDREKPFKGIGMHVAASSLVFGVIDRSMLRFGGHHEFVDGRSVSDESAALVQMLNDGRPNVAVIQVHGTDIATTFNEAEHHRSGLSIRSGSNGLASLGGLRQIGFVGFDGNAFAAERIGAPVLHGFADAMAKEPSSFHAAIQHSLNLTGADAFLAGAHQMDDLQPQVKRQMAGLENGAHTNGEGFFAGVALAKPRSGSFAVETAYAVARAAKGANRTIRPKARFDVLESTGFGHELGSGKNRGGHGGISYGQNSRIGA